MQKSVDCTPPFPTRLRWCNA